MGSTKEQINQWAAPRNKLISGQIRILLRQFHIYIFVDLFCFLSIKLYSYYMGIPSIGHTPA